MLSWAGLGVGNNGVARGGTIGTVGSPCGGLWISPMPTLGWVVINNCAKSPLARVFVQLTLEVCLARTIFFM